MPDILHSFFFVLRHRRSSQSGSGSMNIYKHLAQFSKIENEERNIPHVHWLPTPFVCIRQTLHSRNISEYPRSGVSLDSIQGELHRVSVFHLTEGVFALRAPCALLLLGLSQIESPSLPLLYEVPK